MAKASKVRQAAQIAAAQAAAAAAEAAKSAGKSEAEQEAAAAQAAAAASAVDAEQLVVTRVLVDSRWGKANQVASMTLSDLESALEVGEVDDDPAAVAYAKSLAA